jgi:hypothetical protein
MFNILEEITNLLSGETMTKISNTVGADSVSTGKAIGASIPALIGAMADKAKQGGGADALLHLLHSETSKAQGISDGSLLSDVSGLLNNPSAFGGMEILQTLFGAGQADIEKKVGQVSGLSTGVIGRLLPMLAPLVLGFIGKQFAGGEINADTLTKFLSDQQGYLRANAPGLLGFFERIDANDDGSIVDDVQRLFGRLTGRG